jgi:hypothetical protein
LVVAVKEDSMKKKVSVALSLLVVVIIAAIATYVITYSPPPENGTWELFDEVSGAGNLDTNEFTMHNRWRLVWSVDEGGAYLFIVAVYTKNDGGYSLFAEVDKSRTSEYQGVLPVDQLGSFVIRVVAMNDTNWDIQVEEFVESTNSSITRR